MVSLFSENRVEKVQLMKRVLSQLHWIFTAAFLLALFPLFRRAALPLSIDLKEIGGAYWLGTGVKAVFGAVLLYVLCFPWAVTGAPAVRRFWQSKLLLAEVMVILAVMIRLFGVYLAVEVVVDGIALAELLIRKKEQFGAAVVDVAIPAIYLFIGLVVVFSFQHGVAGLKFAGQYDPFFEHLDRVIFHTNVSQLSHVALHHLPTWSAHALELIYFSLFMQMGAALIITALAGNRRYALQYVATLLVGYYIAIAIFFFWPTLGPFSVCPDHLSAYPTSIPTFFGQETILAKAKLLWQHNLIPEVRSVRVMDYYIGFPCMHVALPIIVIWSLRKWRKMAWMIAIFDIFLVASIVLLEWHYLVDLVAGVVVAGLAIGLNRTRNDPEFLEPRRNQS
jgi:hypothetical protein